MHLVPLLEKRLHGRVPDGDGRPERLDGLDELGNGVGQGRLPCGRCLLAGTDALAGKDAALHALVHAACGAVILHLLSVIGAPLVFQPLVPARRVLIRARLARTAVGADERVERCRLGFAAPRHDVEMAHDGAGGVGEDDDAAMAGSTAVLLAMASVGDMSGPNACTG